VSAVIVVRLQSKKFASAPQQFEQTDLLSAKTCLLVGNHSGPGNMLRDRSLLLFRKQAAVRRV
jgi:hypothetical protein